MTRTAEQLREEGLAQVRAGELENALSLYDAARDASSEDEFRELITINKADAMIALGRTGPEVNELPVIIMRRRTLRHVYLAAYALQFKNHIGGSFERAVSYGQLALRTAEEAGEISWQRPVYLELGNTYVENSKFEEAARSYERVLEFVDESQSNQDRQWSHGGALEGIGYCKIIQGQVEEGLAFVHQSLPYFTRSFDLAESYIDLCYGYLQLGDTASAQQWGEKALSIAEDARHIRNGHYMLGEAAFHAADFETADYHFGELAKFYPEFRSLKNLLFAVDLRSIVNLKI
ncbi:MAG: tetratricopeptide repeat protein [Thermoanaerobaculia bacterium]|nr:tetratricopeptide repeat protein [Thermoanaerobaculia bacterium]